MRTRTATGLLFFLTALLWPSPVLAASTDVPSTTDLRGCTNPEHEERSPGIHIQDFDSVQVTGGLAGLPDRVITGVQPGQRTTLCVGFHNRTGAPVTLAFSTQNVGVDAAGSPTSKDTDDAPFGAASWLELPTPGKVKIEHGELAWVDVKVEVPDDAEAGSNYASVLAVPVLAKEQSGNAKIVPSIAVQVFMDVPTDSAASGEVVNVRSPRVIWWDGWDVGDVPVLEKLRGQGIAPIRFTWRNNGKLTETISGDVVIESDFGGRDVARLDLPSHVILRGAERKFEVTWSKDIPIVGRFTPTIHTKGLNGRAEEHELEPIWVIPAWWYLLAVVLVIAFPLWRRRQARRRYDDLLTRVEAAEARADGGEFGDDAWDDGDDWHTSR